MKFGSNARCRNAYVSSISGGSPVANSSNAKRDKFELKMLTSLLSWRHLKRIHLSSNYVSAEVFITPVSSYMGV